MRLINGRGGYTLIEVMVVASVTALIGAGALAMMLGAVKCFDKTSVETFTDADAVAAMQLIVYDVREAKSVNIIAGGDRLRVVFPVTVTQSGHTYYDRHRADTANQIDFYLSDETGVPGHSGTILWEGKNNNNRQKLRKDVVGLSFEQDTSRSVKITITTQNDTPDGPRQTQLTQRVVYLRNY